MKKLELNYKGGYRQVSKYLTREHDANFALIIDAMVYIHNENLDNLIKIGNKRAVKISNGFLSRQTGLTLDVIKRNVDKIDETGLITAIKKGQGNTRHYIIHIKRISEYIERLEDKFQKWFEDSLINSKKNKERSNEADLVKLKTSQKNYDEILEGIKNSTGKPTNQVDENQPTQNSKTKQPKRAKHAVVETEKETYLETTTEDKNVVVEVFKNKDEDGLYFTYEVDGFSQKVYHKDYENYFNKLSGEEIEELQNKIEELEQEEKLEDLEFDNFEYINDLSHKEIKENQDEKAIKQASRLSNTSEDKIMLTIYNQIQILKKKNTREQKIEYETTKEPASLDVSENNWTRLNTAYENLPSLDNQGKFFVSKKDREDFNLLPEYRQEYVISRVILLEKSDKTASRPARYIAEASQNKLQVIKDPNKRINVVL